MNNQAAAKRVYFQDLGKIAYKEAWDLQEKLFGDIIALKKQIDYGSDQQLITPNHLLFCEHHAVYTLGRSGSAQNLLIDNLQLKARNVEFFRTNRGGDITFHGPGQIVGYPIINLEYFVTGVKEYIFKIEESIIKMLNDYSIEATRLEGATGVWLDIETRRARKICAIGVRTSRWVSMHGFALNVNTDLDYFNHINPCGFSDKAVTSMQKELGAEQDIDNVKKTLKKHISDVFGMEILEQRIII